MKVVNNNFYFTVDQAKEAVYIREILTQGRIFLAGTETSIRGVHTLPGWLYFNALGYKLAGGHPFGGILIFNLALAAGLGYLLFYLGKNLGKLKTLMVGLGLVFSWRIFEHGLWQFNPFGVTLLAMIQMIFLVRFSRGGRKYYGLAGIPTFLAFNAEVAGAASLLAFYILVGAWGIVKKRLPAKTFLFWAFVLPAAGGIILIKQLMSRAAVAGPIYRGVAEGLGTFAGTSFGGMLGEIGKIIGEVTWPQMPLAGVVLFVALASVYFKNQKRHAWVNLTLALLATSFFFFGSNRGWRDWHTFYLYPLLTVALYLMIFSLRKIAAILLVLVVLGAQIMNFIPRYLAYPFPKSDPSILGNELAVVDWIYTKSAGQGFAVYNYTDTFYDYPYQYLFWQYGLPKYGYLPCEYANYPLAHKEQYVPGAGNYNEPKRACDRTKFLIIQSMTNGEKNKDWIDKFRQYHNLTETTEVGEILVEKYERKPNIPDDYCLWLGDCN